MVVVGACGRLVVVAHNTSNVGTTGDIGKTIAVDDAGCAIKQTYQAAGVACAANRAAQDADVVDAGSALGSGCYGAGVARTADANIFQRSMAASRVPLNVVMLVCPEALTSLVSL